LGLVITAGLHEVIGFTPKAAVVIALGCLLIVNFILARRYVFRVGGPAVGQLLRFGTASVVMRGTEYVLFLLMLGSFGMDYLVSLAVAMALSAVTKFLLYRTFVFNARAS
jgi:putative flippase GtrA